MSSTAMNSARIADLPEDGAQPVSFFSDNTDQILTIGPNDNLHITWGAIVSQSAGTHLHEFEAIEDSHILLFVNRGGLEARICQEIFTLSKGQTLLVWPGETCVGAEPHKSQFLCQWLSFAVKRSRGRYTKGAIQVPRVANVSDPGIVSELFRLLIEEYHRHQSKGQGGIPLCSEGPHHLLMSLLSRLNPSQSGEVQPSSAPAVLAERARNYMRANPAEISSIADLASRLDCSVGYLRTAFRSTYGCNPVAYLRQFRMIEARFLLTQTNTSISNIARKCGYADPSHFARVFTREHGMAPTQYRIAHCQQYSTPGI